MSLTSADIYQEFPSKIYHKYKSQCKTNPLLNKLHNDSGYPQDVLTHNTSLIERRKNYVNENKKNLKNFFAERLPPKPPTIPKQSTTIDPSIIFESKRKQHELKNQTKINLHHTIDIQSNYTGFQIKKISQNFYINDKNRDFRKKFLQSQNRISLPYDSDNHRKGTASYVKKYSTVLKKQAYDKVFGPDISSTPGRNIRRQYNTSLSYQRPNKTNRNTAKKSQKSNRMDRKKRFSLLIEKLDGYRKEFDPENKAGINDYVPDLQQDEVVHQSDMITWIQDATKFYKGKNFQKDAERIQTIQDLQKIDNQFFQQMNQHKKSRLRNRQYMMNKQIVQSSNVPPKISRQFDMNTYEDRNMEESKQSISIFSQSKPDQQQCYYFAPSKLSLFERFAIVGKAFKQTLFKSKLYGIENTANIPKAFWMKPTSYELQGSYAFFISIKNGDVEGIQHFIDQNEMYLYQIDHKGRSPLAFACVQNHLHVVKFLLQLDINVDHTCFKHKTPLYYALRNKNKRIVKELLLNGASPWSTSHLPYREYCLNSLELRTLMKNGRKIHLGMQLTDSMSKKIEFWSANKDLINEDEILTFK